MTRHHRSDEPNWPGARRRRVAGSRRRFAPARLLRFETLERRDLLSVTLLYEFAETASGAVVTDGLALPGTPFGLAELKDGSGANLQGQFLTCNNLPGPIATYATDSIPEAPNPTRAEWDGRALRFDGRTYSVASRKPLFMDESAHDWKLVKLGHSLGWTGVALKTCKAQTGAILSLCWAKSHGMDLMVQDLSNPMLAQIPHVKLAAHAQTIMGVESNGMQFYPEASSMEAKIHPELFSRCNGVLNLSTLTGPGFGYRLDEIARPLPEATIGY